MKEAGLVCVLQVGRGWLCELVPMFDDWMRKEGAKTWTVDRRGGGIMSPVALRYLLNKEGATRLGWERVQQG